MNIYQTNFIKNSSIYLKQKRVRNLNVIIAKNLKIASNRFHVWFTLHHVVDGKCKAFYISEKRENERSPKWQNLSPVLSRFSSKEFILRIWYSNLELNDEDPHGNINRLNLLIEMIVNLDSLFYLNEENYNFSVKNNAYNLLIFEMFGLNFCSVEDIQLKNNIKAKENIFKANYLQDLIATKKVEASSQKNSYTLNLMIRTIDYQKVIFQTKKNISQLKTNSLTKFDASSRLRQLQVNREQKLQRIYLFKESLNKLNQSIRTLDELIVELKESNLTCRNRLNASKQNYESDKEKYSNLEVSLHKLLNENIYFENRLKKRQMQLITNLAIIFHIEHTNANDLTYLNVSSNANKMLGNNVGSTITKQDSFKIINASLKFTNYPSVNQDQENSIALGYITQSIQLLADILNMPLRYQLVFRSSKSLVIELNENGAREYALFKTNTTQDDLFPYAISLLNKNISQLRILFDNYRNVDPNEALVNLKWIFDYFKN